MLESITAALDCATFTRRDLQEALKHAGPVEALLLLPMIGRAETLRADLAALREALASKGA